MKRLLIMGIAMVMAVGVVATAEAKQPRRTERTVQGSYGPYPSPVTGCNEPFGGWSCLVVKTRPTEAFFTAKVTDAHRQPVYVMVSGAGRGYTYFCGQTKKPIEIRRRGAELHFILVMDWPSMTPPHVYTDCPTNRVKTTGTIRVTLSNQR